MRPIPLVAAMLLSAAAAVPSTAESPNTENTLRLADDARSPQAEIGDVAWLSGYWRGEGFDGALEEIWSLPVGDRMHGIFTLAQEGKASFSEAMLLVEHEGSLVLKVKHFTPEFVGWEEKDKFVTFPLVRLAENEAYFAGLTFRRDGDALRIFIALTRDGVKTEHELRLERVAGMW